MAFYQLVVKCRAEDEARIRRLSAASGRTMSDVIRQLIRSVDPDAVSLGIPSPPPLTRTEVRGVEAPERGLSAA